MENVFLQANGIKKQNVLTKLILGKDHKVILLKKKQRDLFLMGLICFVQVFLVKHFLLRENVEDLRIQEVWALPKRVGLSVPIFLFVPLKKDFHFNP
jgi:hypothetical protein